MGRPLRLKSPNLTYHVVSRTNGKKLLLTNSRDQRALCKCLQRFKLKYRISIYGFMPMTNHFHLLLKVPQDVDLSQFMSEFKTAFAKYFNHRHQTSGHFWGDRFKSTIVETDRHLLACLRYMDRNPVKAGLVDQPFTWRLGSFHCYALGRKHEILEIELHPLYLDIGSSAIERQKWYLQFVIRADPLSDNLTGRMEKMRVFGSEDFARQWLR